MAEFQTDTKHDFDLEIVKTEFEKCRVDDNTLLLDNYLNAYSELNRFFRLTGRLFAFVAKDLDDKIGTIKTHRNGENGHSYDTIQSMIEYEQSNGLLTVKGPVLSGSRSLLRLHRAMEFILAFMERLRISSDTDKTSHIASSVYHETLARYHPWLVQKMAGLAMYMLPSRRQLMETMCKQDYTQMSVLLEGTVRAGKPVYQITQRLYENNDLLDLP